MTNCKGINMANKTLMPHKHLYYYHALERPCSHVNSSFYDLSTFERGTCRKKGDTANDSRENPSVWSLGSKENPYQVIISCIILITINCIHIRCPFIDSCITEPRESHYPQIHSLILFDQPRNSNIPILHHINWLPIINVHLPGTTCRNSMQWSTSISSTSSVHNH